MQGAAWLGAAGQYLLDLLYPPRCPGCGRIGEAFCAECQAAIAPLPAPACPRCGHPSESERLCPACEQTPSHLERIVSTALFTHPLREAIHELKYNNNRALARPLGARMAGFWQEQALAADLIVPVPLHRSRVAERGYNQAALLARVLAAAVGVPMDDRALARERATRHQVGLGRDERLQNVAGAFTGSRDVSGKCVALVDDVCTTGATLEACAEALKAAGAASVWAFTMARARWAPAEPAPDAPPGG